MIQRDITIMLGGYSKEDIEKQATDGGDLTPEDLENDPVFTFGHVVSPTMQLTMVIRRGTFAEDEMSLRKYIRSLIALLEKQHTDLAWMLEGLFTNEFIDLHENFTY